MHNMHRHKVIIGFTLEVAAFASLIVLLSTSFILSFGAENNDQHSIIIYVAKMCMQKLAYNK